MKNLRHGCEERTTFGPDLHLEGDRPLVTMRAEETLEEAARRRARVGPVRLEELVALGARALDSVAFCGDGFSPNVAKVDPTLVRAWKVLLRALEIRAEEDAKNVPLEGEPSLGPIAEGGRGSFS